MKIALNSIYFGVRQRKDYVGESGKELEDLKQSLLDNGQITAITVSPIPDFVKGKEDYNGELWLLCAGGRRVMAAGMAGWNEIEAYVRETPTELEYRIWELFENLKRKAMSWQEEVDAKAEIFRLRKEQDPSLTVQAMADELGESIATFSRDVTTAQIIKERPGLKKAGSKNAALKAGKELQKHEAKEAVRKEAANFADPVVDQFGPLERRIVTRDAVEFVRSLAPSSIDLVLTDGPYGYNYWKQGQKQKQGVNGHLSQYDDSPEAVGNLYMNIFPELVRVTRESGWLVMFCGTETFILLQDLARNCCVNHAGYRDPELPTTCFGWDEDEEDRCRFLSPEPYPWIWHRKNSRNQPRYPHLHAKNVAELIFVCNLGRGQLLKQPCENLIECDVEYGNTRIHVNQKPVPLLQELIERFTFPGDSVLDPFFGSGNGPAAAAGTGRIPWGSDSNPEMLPFALGRIRAANKPVSKEEIQLSRDRFAKALEMKVEPQGVELPAEETEVLPGLLGGDGAPYVVHSAPGPRGEEIREQRLTGRTT